MLVAALAYGLVRVPRRVWERRDVRLIFGYHCFHLRQYQDAVRDAAIDLADRYAVLQLVKERLWQLPADGPSAYELRDAVESIEASMPATASSYLKGWRRNEAAKKSKFVTAPVMTMPLLVALNGELQAAARDFEMAEHVQEKNLVQAYYYRGIVQAVEQDNPLPAFRLAEFHSPPLLFALLPGTGNQA